MSRIGSASERILATFRVFADECARRGIALENYSPASRLCGVGRALCGAVGRINQFYGSLGHHREFLGTKTVVLLYIRTSVMYRGRPVSLILRYASRLVGAARPDRFSGNEIISAVDAIKAAPAGYGRLKKRIHLFKHMAPIAPLVPTGAEIIVALDTSHSSSLSTQSLACLIKPPALDRARHYDKRFLNTKAAATFSDVFASRYRADLEALSFLEQHEGSFAKLIRENKGSICVVGNSPCEIGRRLGRAIDDHALVVRFNNFSTSPAHAQDYGVKCDVWCRSPFYKDITRRPGFKPSLTITGSPIPWRKEDGQDMAIEYLSRNEPLDSAPNLSCPFGCHPLRSPA